MGKKKSIETGIKMNIPLPNFDAPIKFEMFQPSFQTSFQPTTIGIQMMGQINEETKLNTIIASDTNDESRK